ncbi:hypothetical protein ACFS2C_00855 [Prauserella oleivorans]|uniref:DUF3311 domain-containing protein n=1 Tax=Prauserella oleivorans TaxID=1478153 RepID=A0ABW5W2Z3_9PSEU
MDQRRSAPHTLVEPIRRPGIWAVMVLLMVASVPLYLPSGTVRPLVFGLPYWMVISVVATLLFAAFTSWVCLRRWNLAEPDEERRAEEESTWTT